MAQRPKQDGVWYEYPGQGVTRLGYRVYLLVNANVDALRNLARFADAQQWGQNWLIKQIDRLDLAASRRDLEQKFWPPKDPKWDFTALIAIKARDMNTMKQALPIVLKTLGIPDPTAYVLETGIEPYTPNW